MDLHKEIIGIVRFLEEKKAEDVCVLDISKQTSMTDYFIIAGGTVQVQLESISIYLQEFLKKKGYLPRNSVRGDNSGWILLDYGDFVIHLFINEIRDFYKLERIWGEGRKIWPETECTNKIG